MRDPRVIDQHVQRRKPGKGRLHRRAVRDVAADGLRACFVGKLPRLFVTFFIKKGHGAARLCKGAHRGRADPPAAGHQNLFHACLRQKRSSGEPKERQNVRFSAVWTWCGAHTAGSQRSCCPNPT